MIPLPRVLYRSYRREETARHELFYLFFEITRRCNLSCLHCGSDCQKSDRGRELTTESWIRIAEDIVKHFGTRPFIVLTGGEPLVHRDLLKIGQALHDLGLRWGMVSNAFAWHDGLIEELCEAGLRSITFSLDGPEDCHSWLRGHGGSWPQVLRALDDCRHFNERTPGQLEWDVVTCAHPQNLQRLDQTASILVDHGVPRWRVFRIFPAGRAKTAERLALNQGETQALLEWIATRRPQLRKRGLSLTASCEGWFPPALESRIRDQHSFCRSGINFAAILADGSICGCNNNHPSFHQGNILEDSFPRLWREGFKEHRERSWLADSICGECTQLADCAGGPLHLWGESREAPLFCYHRN